MTMKSPKFQDISSYPLLGLVPSETAHNTYLHLDCGYIHTPLAQRAFNLDRPAL